MNSTALKLKYATMRNPLAKEGEVSYLGVMLHNGTETLDTLAKRVAEEGVAAREAEARLAVRVAASVIRRMVSEELLRVKIGPVTFEPAISGSVAAIDAPLSPANRIYVNVRTAEAYTRRVGAITPILDSSDALIAASPAIDKVEDTSTYAPGIVGTGVFVITGKGLFASREGECVEIVDANGVATEAVIDSDPAGVSTGERLYAHFAEAPAPGAYALRVTTYAGGEVLGVAARKVNVLNA